jgi:WD40 repeat protein
MCLAASLPHGLLVVGARSASRDTYAHVYIYDMNNLAQPHKIIPLKHKIVERLSVSGNRFAFVAEKNAYVYSFDDLNTPVFTKTTPKNLRSVLLTPQKLYYGEVDTGKVYYCNNDRTGAEEGFFLTNHTDPDDIRDICLHGDKLYLAGNDNRAYIVDADSYKVLHTFTDPILHVEVAHADQDYIWFGSDDKTVWIKQNEPGYPDLARLIGPTSDITCVRRDGPWWFVACDDGAVYVYKQNGKKFQLIRTIAEMGLSGGDTGWHLEFLCLDTHNHRLFTALGGTGQKLGIYRYKTL